jgi:hypothetical protein
MGQASASSSATSAVDSSGGALNINQPNVAMWIVLGLGLIIGAYLWFNRKK